jgi:hypothetical protein
MVDIQRIFWGALPDELTRYLELRGNVRWIRWGKDDSYCVTSIIEADDPSFAERLKKELNDDRGVGRFSSITKMESFLRKYGHYLANYNLGVCSPQGAGGVAIFYEERKS